MKGGLERLEKVDREFEVKQARKATDEASAVIRFLAFRGRYGGWVFSYLFKGEGDTWLVGGRHEGLERLMPSLSSLLQK